jgi:lysozyme family protein
MEITGIAIRYLQRALNALGRGNGARHLLVDGRLGRKTVAAFVRFLAARGPEGEAALARALAALRSSHLPAPVA